MSNDKVPTGPDDTGHWYRTGGKIVLVKLNPDGNLFNGLIYFEPGSQHGLKVEDDGKWLGPVPMPGEWAPRELFDRLLDAALDTGFPHQAVTDAMEWKEATQ